MIDDKLWFLYNVRLLITHIAKGLEQSAILYDTFLDRNYGPGGASAITDEELAVAGISRGDLVEWLRLAVVLADLARADGARAPDARTLISRLRLDV